MSTPVEPIVMLPLERPLVINAICARLSTDCLGADMAGRKLLHTIPTDELKLVVAILESAREVVRQHSPNDTEKHRGAGTDGQKIVSIEKLVDAVKSELAT